MTDDDTPALLWTRVVLVLGVLSGILGGIMMTIESPEQFTLASDVYLYAGEALLSGADVYEVHPPDRPGYHYLYPPVITFLFVPYALFGSELASYVIQTTLNLAVGIAMATLLYRALDRRGVAVTRTDFWLFVAFVLVSAYGMAPLINGQVTHWLALAFVAGFVALERGDERLAGVAFAGAALVKVFPAAIGLLLLRLRAVRAVGVAVATGVGGLLVGVLALGPELTRTYFSEVLFGRYEGTAFEGTPDPTRTAGGIQRQIAALLDVGPELVAPLALFVLSIPVLFAYRRVDTDERRQAAALATIAATLLFFPLQPLYFLLLVYPLVVLLYRLPSGPPRSVLVAGALFSFVHTSHEHVVAIVELSPLSGSAAAALLSVSETAFTVILPTTIGLWLLLAACVLVQYRTVDDDG